MFANTVLSLILAEYYHDNPPQGGAVIHTGSTTVHVHGYPVQQQPQPVGYPTQQQPGYQQQGYPSHQNYHHPTGGYPQTGHNQQHHGYHEAPPPYTERETMPSAPPAEKM